MSEDLLNQEQVVEEIEDMQIGCKMCGNSEVEDNYQLALCNNCRDKLSKMPLPIWIKGIFVLMVIVLIVALIRFPSTIKAGIAFERGTRAEAAGKYLTAMEEYNIVTERFPDSTLSLGRLFITTYNNGRINEAYEIFQKIAGRKPSDQSFVSEVNGVVERLEKIYFASDDLNKLFKEHQNDNPEQVIGLLKAFLKNNSGDIQASYYLSNLLFDQEKYDEAESVMANILATNPDFYDGHLLMAAVHREKGNYEKAIESCNIVIKHNVEYPSAYASLAKVELKFHNDLKGLEMAKKAYELDQNDSHVVATLSMAYHYNNMIKERDDMLNRFKQFKDNNAYDLNLLNGIFGGQQKWRN